MKKLIIFILTIFTIIFSSNFALAFEIEYNQQKHEYTGSIYTLMVNDEIIQTSVPPIIFNDYALVPIRDVMEPMGAEVNYIPVSKQVFINYKDKYLRLKINSNLASVNEEDIIIPGDISPLLISVDGCSAKTMIPVRFVSENLGFDVDFDGENGIIKINEKEEIEMSSVTKYSVSSNDTSTSVKITFDKPVAEHTNPVINQNNTLYFDITNCKYLINSTNAINKGAVKNL